MAKFSITIIEPSAIINDAIKEHLKKTSLFNLISTFYTWDSFINSARQNTSQLLLINPLQIVNKEKEFDKFCQQQPIEYKIAIVYHLLPNDLISIFDDVFYIHESIDKLVQKIKLGISSKEISTTKKQNLTEREKEILKLLAKGLSIKEIAQKVFLSPHTVLSHRKNISAKTGIKTIAGLTVYAVSMNLISIEEIES